MAAVVPLVPARAREGAGAWLLLRRCTVAAVVPLVPARAREGAGAWLLLRRRCTVAAVVPLVPDKAREGAGAWLLRRRCTVAAVVPLVPDKARKGAWGWLLRRRYTVAAVVPLVPDKARKGAWGWLLLRRQSCTVAAAVASHERFRTITMTTTVLRRRTRDIIAGAAAATAANFHRLGRFVPLFLFLFYFFRSTNQCTNLDYRVQCVFARDGPVRLPQHLQFINRLSSPIRSLSLLRSLCSPLLTSRFPFSAIPAKVCKPPNPKSDIVFQGPGRVTIR